MKIGSSFRWFSNLGIALFLTVPTLCSAKIATVAKDPYAGAIVVDAATGQVLFEKNADLPAYPASVVKLMGLLIILEKIDQGYVSLSNTVTITAEVSTIGGRQVWLKEKEVFTVEELLYAMVVHSANDAAAALAIHIAGSRSGFVDLMNKRAAELGMTATRFRSVHGLPPGRRDKEQTPDISTARDLAILARELVKRPVVFHYTSIRARTFRPNAPAGEARIDMVNPNHYLLEEFDGCDGLKTGSFGAAGHSVVATAQRNGRRVIAVILGAKSRTTRDDEAARLMSKAFLELPPLPPPKPVITNVVPVSPVAVAKPRTPRPGPAWGRVALLAGIGLVAVWGIAAFVMRRSRPSGF
jgi:D-alanyl-D-alanine carboxypeptidase (penicillin-binding protein 5/6)